MTSHHFHNLSKRKQPTPLFAPWIEHQCTQKQSNTNANRHLHHPISHIENRTRIYRVCARRACAIRGVKKALRAVVDDAYATRVARNLFSRDEASYETAGGCKATGHLERKKRKRM
jgi:hypothetical protein